MKTVPENTGINIITMKLTQPRSQGLSQKRERALGMRLKLTYTGPRGIVLPCYEEIEVEGLNTVASITHHL